MVHSFSTTLPRAIVSGTARPEIVITLKPKERPRHEIMRELRGPSKDAFDPNQDKAEGVN